MRFHTDFVFTDNSGRPSCHASTLAELADGTLLCAWYAGDYEKHPNVAIQLSRRAPGALDWSAPVVIQDTPGLSEGNPVLYVAPDGVVWLFYVTMHGGTWNDCKVYYRQSCDGGATWGDPTTLREPTGWMTKNKPIRLEDGALLLPLYDEVRWTSHVLRSDDEGRTWTCSNSVTGPYLNIQPTLMPLRDGRILMMLRTGGGGPNLKSYSADGGRTWDNPGALTDLPNPNSGTDGVTLASGALAFIWNPSATERTPLAVSLSDDDGETWPVQRLLETDPAEFSYPVIIQARDGLIHVAYTWRRERIRHAEFDEAWLRAK